MGTAPVTTGMNKVRLNNSGKAWLCLAGLAGVLGSAWAQPAPEPADASSPVAANPCRIEVAKFERAFGFVRQSTGNEMAARIRESLLPAKIEADILMREGYCGLAKYMREQKLLDKLR